MDKKKLKKRIRERAERTGESYSTARKHVLHRLEKERHEKTLSTAKKARSGPATGAVSEEKCIEKTGYGFDHWFEILDRFGAVKKGHTAAARHLREEHGVSAWYSQSITVLYERARGMRKLNQTCDGAYQVSVSRVLPVTLEQAIATIKDAELRAHWLGGLESGLSGALEEALKSKGIRRTDETGHIRFRLEGSVFELRATAKDDGRSAMRVMASKLRDAEAVEVQRTSWRGALEQLRVYLRNQA